MARSQKITTKSTEPENFEYKKELAFQLVKRFGLTAARRTCEENRWQEVLKAVNSVRSH